MAPHHKIYPYRNNGRFANAPGEGSKATLWSSVGMFIQSLLTPRSVDDKLKSWCMPAQEDLLKQASIEPRITWVGHSTFLIEIDGIRILTDPVFFGLSFFFPRMLPAALSLDALPPIDAVIISHNHRDHMDEPSLRALFAHTNCHFFVPFGDKAWFAKRGCSRVTEASWWEEFTVFSATDASKSATLTFLPAWHWSQRGLFDHNTSLWGSWMIKTADSCIYFAGDTAYSKHFKAIATEFPQIDIALMPIGPCEPRAGMKKAHVSAEEAGLAFLDLNARHFIPMHWGTFAFGTDNLLLPVDRLHAWWGSHNHELALKELHGMKMGETRLFLKEPKEPTSQESNVSWQETW